MLIRLFKYVLSIFLMLTNSCIVYHPQIIDIPLISKKNDLRIDAGISIFPSVNATVSYGLTDKIALQAFGSLGSDERYYFQGATGIFKKYDNQKIMEIYGGYGYGYGRVPDNSDPGGLYCDYQQYFLQINYGKIDCKFANMDYGLGLKAGLFHSNMYFHPYSETTYFDNNLLIEPTLFLRLGGERLKFNIKLGGCLFNKFTISSNGLPYSNINFGLGLNYIF